MKNQKNELSEEEDMEDMEAEQESTYQKVRRISITLPEDIAKEAEKYAKEHHMKRSQVLALALERGLGDENRIFKKLNRIEALVKKNNSMAKSKEEKQLEDEKTLEEKVLTNKERENIAELLIDCSSTFSPFEIMGEDGFLVQVQERQLIGAIWTDEMLEIVAENLSVGYDNWYISKPEPQELIDACKQAMELSEDQTKILTDYFVKKQEGKVVYTEESEKGEK